VVLVYWVKVISMLQIIELNWYVRDYGVYDFIQEVAVTITDYNSRLK